MRGQENVKSAEHSGQMIVFGNIFPMHVTWTGGGAGLVVVLVGELHHVVGGLAA